MTRSVPPPPWQGLELERLNPHQRRLFDAAYALGYSHGIDRGREQAEAEMAAVWAETARKVGSLAGTRTFDELLRLRGEAA